ncbi:MAG: hypothetical protein K2Y10_09555 [Burkholderiaceae bacterium]|nr:hypothetical protein [Burkholderiaceae bacterium]
MSPAIDIRTFRTRAATAPQSSALGGNSVQDIVAMHCTKAPVLAGVVIERLDAQIGVWQYSLDDSQTWQAVRTDLLHRNGPMGLALALNARLRVLPFGGHRGSVQLVFHPVPFVGGGNGIYRPYPPTDERPEAPTVTLVLGLAAINGAPQSVYVPRLRNKRALAAARAAG